MTTETPKPVGYWCDHTDEPRDARTHEGWDLTDDGQEWTRQPGTISAHTGLDEWDPEQRRCPKAVPVYSIDAPALTAQVERLTADAAGWRTAYDRLAAQARRFRWAYMSARRGRRSARLLNQELTTSYERTLRIVQAERDEARAQRDAVAAAAEADDQRNANALADYQAKVTELTGELYEIRTRDETVGGVLYDVVHRCQTGDLDDHQAVRAIDERLIHPLVAKLQEARAKANRGAGRRRTGAEQVGLAQQRHAVLTLIRDAYTDANVDLKDGDPWPNWGPSIDALDILRALGALEGTVATTLAGEHRG